MQFDREVSGIRLVNVGSVGWSYGGQGAYWALLDEDIELRCTGYDLALAADEMRAYSSWPRLETFLAFLTSPPSREDALAFFERAAD